MTSSDRFGRFAFAFGPTFAVLYVVTVAKDLALFTVFPSLGIERRIEFRVGIHLGDVVARRATAT